MGGSGARDVGRGGRVNDNWPERRRWVFEVMRIVNKRLRVTGIYSNDTLGWWSGEEI